MVREGILGTKMWINWGERSGVPGRISREPGERARGSDARNLASSLVLVGVQRGLVEEVEL